jgi:glyoxylase-like metal-dependent hydrolase (beta-lactamase superfamily II)
VDDEDADDADQLHESRRRIRDIADRIIPGHGPAFEPTDESAPV